MILLLLAVVRVASTGLALQEKSLSYVIIEKETIVFHFQLSFTCDFLCTSDCLEIGNIPFLSPDIRPTRTELLKYYRLVTVQTKESATI